jgi:hypothetical protein
MQEIDFYLVDAFSNISFGGNRKMRFPTDYAAAPFSVTFHPAAICSAGKPLPDCRFSLNIKVRHSKNRR